MEETIDRNKADETKLHHLGLSQTVGLLEGGLLEGGLLAFHHVCVLIGASFHVVVLRVTDTERTSAIRVAIENRWKSDRVRVQFKMRTGLWENDWVTLPIALSASSAAVNLTTPVPRERSS